MKINFSSSLIFVVTAVIIFFGTMATYVVYKYTQNSIYEITREQLSNTVLNITTEYEPIFSSTRTTTQVIAQDEELMAFLSNPSDTASEALLHKLDFFTPETLFDAIYLINPEGETIFSTDPTFIGKNYGFRDYYQKAMSGESYTDILLVTPILASTQEVSSRAF
jgi:C4-dicarboxylate-specific signal transduction histidine kinase